MNPYSGPPDAFSTMPISDVTSSPSFMPPFSMDMPTTAVSSSDIMGWTPMENDLVANMMPGTSVPMSQMETSTYYSPTTVNDGLMDPMLDNQQVQMMMLMMQQQQQQQQQQQFLLLQEQQQQMQLQQQQQQQQQQELQARRASQQQRLYQQQLQQQQQQQLQQQQQQQQQHLNSQPPHWFIKQQQAKLIQQNMNNMSTTPSPVQVLSPPSLPSNKPMLDTNAVMSKRIELILTINQEIIRLCLEHQQPNLIQREPDLTLYQIKLQSNLTYLATMADISMTKPEDQLKLPAPPDLTMLPTPFTPTAHKIHRLYEIAQRLFYRQPQQQAQHTQDEPSMSPHPQQLMMQQQQMQPSDFSKMMLMQQQQQLQQQGNLMVNSLSGGGGGGSISSNSSSVNNYMYPNTTQMMMMTPRF
ncbi:ERMES complex subunit [Mucor velutinosus]|uniref:ERMES complex subunit n=1 Tax=Mucor velutinosus TaxID=708070 RepID=A0AAN7DC10_9FUNG|nr:ERMES complex subunit [Mucor velutinosus]